MKLSSVLKSVLALTALVLAQASWAASSAVPAAGPFMADAHAKRGVKCASCHGPAAATKGDTVANAACAKCHGDFKALAAKSAAKGLADRNPHASHLGEVDCVVCHKGHEASEAYCNGCHKKFKMSIPNGTAKK